MYNVAERHLRVIDEQMDVVAHETPCDNRHIVGCCFILEQLQKEMAISIIFKDDLLTVSSQHDMVKPGF